MAQQVNTILVDFEDGARADETVDLGLDGRQYEVDLSRADAEGLRQSSIPSRPHDMHHDPEFAPVLTAAGPNGPIGCAFVPPRRPADLGQVGRPAVPESGVVAERGTPVLLQHADGRP
jgi:hypothetical protein